VFANIILAALFPLSFENGITPYALIRRIGEATTLISLDKSLIL
jgi:hypothetical protein